MRDRGLGGAAAAATQEGGAVVRPPGAAMQRGDQLRHAGRALRVAVGAAVGAAREAGGRVTGRAKGSRPSTSRVGEPCMPSRAASASFLTVSTTTLPGGASGRARPSRYRSSGRFGQSGTASSAQFHGRLLGTGPILA